MDFIAEYELLFRRNNRYLLAASYPYTVSLNIRAMNLKSW